MSQFPAVNFNYKPISSKYKPNISSSESAEEFRLIGRNKLCRVSLMLPGLARWSERSEVPREAPPRAPGVAGKEV